MNFEWTQANIFASGWQDLQMPDRWVFLILMLENALFCFCQCCDFKKFNPPPNPTFSQDFLCSYFTVWSHLCVTGAYYVIAIGTNTEGPCLTLVVMFLKVAAWSETVQNR